MYVHVYEILSKLYLSVSSASLHDKIMNTFCSSWKLDVFALFYNG